MIQIIAFVVFSALIIYISRAALRKPGTHGFYRFFAWECILGLFLFKVEGWFVDPLAWYQVISWLLLLAALVPLAFGVQRLRSAGKPAPRRAGEPELLGFEKTTQLVTTGIYQYIRHPLYSSLLLLAWGIFFKLPDVRGLLLAGSASSFLMYTARADEAECLRYFGKPYAEYMKRTRRFIPFLF
jgi:protein-S-isoprenylcysteine O-methyltransferase Ste14